MNTYLTRSIAISFCLAVAGCGKGKAPPPTKAPPTVAAADAATEPKADAAAEPKADAAAEPKADAAAVEPKADAAAVAGDAAAAAPKVLSIHTKSPEALKEYQLGETMGYNARAADAVAHFKKAFELDPAFAQAQFNAGVMTPGAEGVAMMEKAVAAAASLPEADRLYLEADLAQRKGDEAKAAELEKKVAELAPDDWRVHLAMARRSMMANDMESALKGLTRAVELNPEKGALGSIYNQMGYANFMAGKKDDAIAAFEKYVATLPDEPNPRDSLAEAQLGAGKLADAEANFKKANELSPTFSMALSGAAAARALSGDWKGAAELAAKAIESGPRPVDKLEARFEAAWLTAAHGDVAGADKELAAIEQEAEAAGDVAMSVFAGIDRAVLLMLDKKLDDADKALMAAWARGEKAAWAGGGLAAAKRIGTGLHAVLAAQQGKAEDAKKYAAELDELAKAVPNNAMAQSLAKRTHGMLLMATDAKAAIAEFASCLPQDTVCKWYEVMAREASGDKEGAAGVKQAIVDTPLRGMMYVFVRAKLGSIPEPVK